MDDTVADYIPTKILFECVDSYAIRILIDILSDFCTTPTLQFTSSGLVINESNSKSCVMMNYVIDEQWLKAYKFELRDVNGNNIGLYSFKVQGDDFLSAVRGIDGKRAFLNFSIDVDEAGGNSGLYVLMNNISGREFVKTFGHKEPIIDVVDIYQVEYSDDKPNARVPTSTFSNMITRFKGRKCTSIAVSLCQNGRIFMHGMKGNDIVSPNALDSLDEEDDGESADMNGCEVISSIRINRSETDWLAKLVRLAPSSIVQVFMKPNKPLVLRTPIGTQGCAIFTFKDDPHITTAVGPRNGTRKVNNG